MSNTSPCAASLLLPLLLLLHAPPTRPDPTTPTHTCATGYTGGPINYVPFWLPNSNNKSKSWNVTQIPHTPLPYVTTTGYTIQAGHIGLNEFARPDILRTIDGAAVPWKEGTVDEVWGLPNSTDNGYVLRTTSFHTNFNQGLDSKEFVVLKQKGSIADNVDIVKDKVDNVEQNVLRLQMQASGSGDGWYINSGAVVQTTDLFASGRFSIKAKVPRVKGMVWALWTFHYETHYDAAHLPKGDQDSQFVPDVTGYISRLNHEIDWEMPASCSGLCKNGGCPGQWDTANFNSYLYANNNGIGPGFLNMCARSPSGRTFIPDDGNYHTYTIEWHSGNTDDLQSEIGCPPHIDYFMDGEYVTTIDVFVPSRGSRFVFGPWAGNKNWAGKGDWKNAQVLVSEVSICPFNENYDSMYPQRFDQPNTVNKLWGIKNVPPVLTGLTPPVDRCPGSAPSQKCTGSSDRPNGCACVGSGTGPSGDSAVCSSACCDPFSLKCQPNAVCASECAATNNRTAGCTCKQNDQCRSNCCGLDNTCSVNATTCTQPCSNSIDRPNKCSCSTAAQCYTECCDYNSVPGFGNGTCADSSVCTQECSSDSKPVGCGCNTMSDCQTKCCSDGRCKFSDSCPNPGNCGANENKAVGCACTHSWQCASQWCEDLKCTDH
jgi:hypothetical protein